MEKDDNILPFAPRKEPLQGYHEEIDAFEADVEDQMALLYDLTTGPEDYISILDKATNAIHTFQFSDVVEAITRKINSGTAKLRVTDDHVAEIIPLKKSIKPKRPRSPQKSGAMLVRKELTKAEQQCAAEAKIFKQIAKAGLQLKARRRRAEELAYLRERYGEDGVAFYQKQLAG